MKTLQNITQGFKVCDTQKIEINENLRYYFLDYSDMNIPTANGGILQGKISRYSGGYESSVKWYESRTKFENAIRRIVKMQIQ